MVLDDNLETDKNDSQKDQKLSNGTLRNSFYRNMCFMYESRLEFYKDNIDKVSEFGTLITKKFITNYKNSYEHFRKKYSL